MRNPTRVAYQNGSDRPLSDRPLAWICAPDISLSQPFWQPSSRNVYTRVAKMSKNGCDRDRLLACILMPKCPILFSLWNDAFWHRGLEHDQNDLVMPKCLILGLVLVTDAKMHPFKGKREFKGAFRHQYACKWPISVTAIFEHFGNPRVHISTRGLPKCLWQRYVTYHMSRAHTHASGLSLSQPFLGILATLVYIFSITRGTLTPPDTFQSSWKFEKSDISRDSVDINKYSSWRYGLFIYAYCKRDTISYFWSRIK